MKTISTILTSVALSLALAGCITTSNLEKGEERTAPISCSNGSGGIMGQAVRDYHQNEEAYQREFMEFPAETKEEYASKGINLKNPTDSDIRYIFNDQLARAATSVFD